MKDIVNHVNLLGYGLTFAIRAFFRANDSAASLLAFSSRDILLTSSIHSSANLIAFSSLSSVALITSSAYLSTNCLLAVSSRATVSARWTLSSAALIACWALSSAALISCSALSLAASAPSLLCPDSPLSPRNSLSSSK